MTYSSSFNMTQNSIHTSLLKPAPWKEFNNIAVLIFYGLVLCLLL